MFPSQAAGVNALADNCCLPRMTPVAYSPPLMNLLADAGLWVEWVFMAGILYFVLTEQDGTRDGGDKGATCHSFRSIGENVS